MESKTILKNQIAIVTGASSGIGKGCALHLAKHAASVVVNHLPSETGHAQEVVDQIKSEGGNAIAIAADVSKEEDVENLFKQTREKLGTVHILINNAGIQRDSDFTKMTMAQWEKVISVNLTGQFLCARAAAREFIRRGMQPEISASLGKIICISSVHKAIPWAGHVNYATSKGGIEMMMKTLAQELAPQKIRVNAIAPGAIKTPINRGAWETEEEREKLLRLIPYGRIGNPKDIARAAVWLASDDSDYVIGSNLIIDGGMMLYPGFRTGG